MIRPNFLFSLALTLLLQPIYAQYSEPHTYKIEREAQYPGGDSAIIAHVRAAMIWPQEAIDNCVEGRVIINFMVDKKGEPQDFKITRGLGYGIDSASLTAVRAISCFDRPATLEGKPVISYYAIPLTWKLE